MSIYASPFNKNKISTSGLKIGDILTMICNHSSGNPEYDGSIVKVLKIYDLNTIRVEIVKGYHRGTETYWSVDSATWGYEKETDWDE